MNKFLKFNTQEQADSVLMLDSETPKYANIDRIGTIYKATGEYQVDEDGNKYPVQAPLDGYHVNVWVSENEDALALVAYELFPANPVRVWAS